jgi:hypothetical protein
VIPKGLFEGAALDEDKGPILQARPIRDPMVAIYSDPREAERARRLDEGIMKTRLDRFGAAAAFVLTAIEDENSVARALDHLLRARPDVVRMASTTAPAGPEDTVGRAIEKIGCKRESFLAVEPGICCCLLWRCSRRRSGVSDPRDRCRRSRSAAAACELSLDGSRVSSLGHGGSV